MGIAAPPPPRSAPSGCRDSRAINYDAAAGPGDRSFLNMFQKNTLQECVYVGDDGDPSKAPAPLRHRKGHQCILPTAVSMQEAELARLLQTHAYWTTSQREYLDRVKSKIVGRQTSLPSMSAFGNNFYDKRAIGAWDAYRRCSMLEPLVADVLQKGVSGDFLEAGVFRGGTSVFMAAMLLAAGQLGNGQHAAGATAQRRRMWIADAFGAGMPPDDYMDRLFERKNMSRQSVDEQRISWAGKFKDPMLSSAVVAASVACHLNITCSQAGRVSLENLRMPSITESFASKQRFHDLAIKEDDRVRRSLEEAGVHLIEGYFNETLPGSVGQLALLRLDADSFAPTYEVLERLYPRLSAGGYVVFDDWKILQSQQAILQFRREQNITTPIFASLRSWPPPLQTIDCMAFWRKEAPMNSDSR
jgi:hypothetical protein